MRERAGVARQERPDRPHRDRRPIRPSQLQPQDQREPSFGPAQVPGRARGPPEPTVGNQVLPIRALNASDAAGTRARLRALRTHRFVDLKTRAVFVDLNVHNPTLDRLCLVRLAVEIYPSGRVVTGTSFRSLQLFRWHATVWNVARTAINGLIMIFVCFYTLAEVREASRMGLWPVKESVLQPCQSSTFSGGQAAQQCMHSHWTGFSCSFVPRIFALRFRTMQITGTTSPTAC